MVFGAALAALLALVVLVTALRRWRHDRDERLREDLLKRFHQCERQRRDVQLEALAGMLTVGVRRARHALDRLMADGLIRADAGRLALTPRGREAARALVRRHRVIETYLAEREGLPLAALHRRADRLEHRLSSERIDALDRALGHPVRDPHGDLIPDGGSRDGVRSSVPLDLCPPGTVVEVAHVEDEPGSLLDELIAHGVVPGVRLEVLRVDDRGMGVAIAGAGAVWLPAPSAGQVDVVPSPASADELRSIERLDDLPLDRAGRIVMLTSDLRGEQRRRLLDLGLTPGTEIRPVLTNALGDDPRAYLVRQSKIALRRDQASHVLVAATSPAVVGRVGGSRT